MKRTITAQELRTKINQQEPLYLLDVRSLEEHQAFNIGGELIPLPVLKEHINEIPTDLPIVVYCRSGNRSQTAVDILEEAGIEHAQNLIGGILAWQQLD